MGVVVFCGSYGSTVVVKVNKVYWMSLCELKYEEIYKYLHTCIIFPK